MQKREKRRDFFEIADEYFRRAEHMMERSLAPAWDEVSCSMEPLYNITVGANEVLITVDLPYVASDRVVKIKVVGEDTIEVTADTHKSITLKELGVKHRRTEFSKYHAIIHSPVSIDEKGLQTRMKRGILEIHLPRIL